MRKLLALVFLLSIAFSAQINYLAGGDPIALERHGGYYVAATSGMLYVFEEDGTVSNYLNLDGISDMEVDDDVIVVTLTSQDFPNIRAYSFPGLEPLWDFEPEIDVFDMSLIWTRKQTRSWLVKRVLRGFGVASGYTLYIFSKSGEMLGNFTAESDIWDFTESGDYYLATQGGVLYTVGQQFNLKEKRQLCEDYVLIDRVSNSTLKVFPRSVWEVNPNMAVCEDGSVHFLSGGRLNIREYTASQLYSYYYQTRRETGYGSQMFRNLKLDEDGRISVAYTTEKFSVFSNSELSWENDISIADLDIYDGDIYALTVSRLGIETVKVYDAADGTPVKEIEVAGISCEKGGRKILAGDKLFIASACEIKLADSSGNVLWYLPMSQAADFLENGDFRVFYTDNEETQYNKPQFYSLFAMDGPKLLWTYSLPDDMADDGYLSGIHIVGDNNIAAVYSADGDDRLVLIWNNGTAQVRNATDRVYAGMIDQYLLNKSIRSFVSNYSFSQLENIPEEFKYGGDTDPDRWGESNVLLWLEILSRLPVSVEAMEGLREVMREPDNYLLRRQIRKTDTCDFNSDGYEDLFVATDSYMLVRDGRTFEELFFKDSNRWRYENNRINRPYLGNFTADWFRDGGTALCLDDMNGDGTAELLTANWNGNATMLFSSGRNHSVRWQVYYKNLATDRIREIEDIDGDGAADLIISNWVQDRPDNVFFISSKDARARYSFTPHQYSLRPAVGDIDGDGVKESILTYDYEGAVLVVFSPKYKFEYDELREFWETWNAYGQVMPAEIIPDVNGDGHGDIVMGVTRRWGDPGTMLVFFDGKTQKLMKQVAVDGQEEGLDPEEWKFIPDMRRFGDFLVFTIPGQQGSGRLGVYNLPLERMEAYVSRDPKEAVTYGDDLVLIGSSGEVFWLSSEDFPVPEVSADGSMVHVTSDPEYYTTVYVDGGAAASGRKSEFNVRLSNDDHQVVVSLANEGGMQQLFTQDVTTFTSSDLGFLNKIVIAVLVIFGIFKVKTKWK